APSCIQPGADLDAAPSEAELANGPINRVEGTVRNQVGEPVAGAVVEIWQACHSGRYNHPEDTNTAELDPHFQYWGLSVTNQMGQYRFRTIMPGVYPAEEGWDRPPHIHFKISHSSITPLITQLYFAGHALNGADQILQKLDSHLQNELIVELEKKEDELWPVAHFNIRI
ncbi:MAG: hypothetical protein K2P92_09245, partial [Bdellovibrionaceae bacterium]|nr:hypothetical protein [Pseudobdellovibrionaceae bacterium]